MDTPEGQKEAVLSFRKARKSTQWVPMSMIQAFSFRERSLKGPIIVSKVQVPCPPEADEVNLRSKLWEILKSKSEGLEKLDPPAPCPESYDGEWIGVRNDVKDSKAPQPDVSEQEKFNIIQQNRNNDVTLFYLSGNAWFRAGPPGARPLTKQLCTESGGSRAFTFQYRLVPQYTLPTLFLDVLVAYFYLISPPPGSFHEPVDPKKLVLVAESGGGTLHFGILQFIQSLCQTAAPDSPILHFSGRDIPLQMPAGLAVICPGSDLTTSMPSVKKFEKIDWLSEGAPWLRPNFPADDIWPSNPPRGELHCDNSALCHPFMDPSMCTDWTGMPPMWLACGEESLTDGIKFLAKGINDSGKVPVTLIQYEFMPHVWNVVIPYLPQSRHVMKLCGKACREFVDFDDSHHKQRKSEAWYVKLGRLEMVRQSFDSLLDLPRDDILRRAREARDQRINFIWRGPTVGSAKI